jgi:DNA-binding transcriptional LysR family regulator
MAESEGDLERRLPREIKLRGLRVLLAVAKQGSFRKAGRQLHLTQPAITAAIAELEQTLGVPLFERTAQGVTPTAYGESFIGRAGAIFGELRLAAEDIDIISRGARGTLRVGTGGGGWGMGILPAALTRLLEPHPEAFILIREAEENVLVELLKARELDLFFSRLTPLAADPELAYQPLFEDAICVLARRTHPLAARKQVSWEELANERWVAPPSGALSFDHVQRTLHKGGLVMPRHVIESTSAPLALGMVVQGNFLCFGTHLYYEYSVLKPMLTILKVDLPKVKVAFGVVTLKERELNHLARRLVGLVAESAHASRNADGIGDVIARPAARGARAKSPAPRPLPSPSRR